VGAEYARIGALNVGGRVGAFMQDGGEGEGEERCRHDKCDYGRGQGSKGEGMVVVVVLLCSQLRGARLTESKVGVPTGVWTWVGGAVCVWVGEWMLPCKQGVIPHWLSHMYVLCACLKHSVTCLYLQVLKGTLICMYLLVHPSMRIPHVIQH
jgi:hypothetical protein